MEKFFKLKESGTTVTTEIIAGATTFFTMVYIIFVNPGILSQTGMNWNAVFVATILATIIGTLIMALVANVPYALAPGMGLNAFFTFTVCFALGFSWQEALTLVFICGLLNVLITVTRVRKSIIKAIPKSLQSAIGGGIGIFIAYIGVKGMGLLQFISDPFKNSVIPIADLPDGTMTGVVHADSSIVPELVLFNSTPVILAVIGLVIMIILLVMKIKGAIFIGIVATTLIGLVMGVVTIPEGFKPINVEAIGDLGLTAGAIFSAEGFGHLFSDPSKFFLVFVTIFAFSLSDTFDTIGTFIGTGRVTGIFDAQDEKDLAESKGFKSKMDKALFADATATSIGALLGTSNTTTYIESSAGIAEGGRTGLTSVVVAVLFALCLPFAGLFGLVPTQATSPALVVVGIMMMGSFAEIKWSELEEAVPAFMAGVFMAFVYNISYGIAAAFIFYCIVKLVTGKYKEIHPIVYGAALLFLLNFILLALPL
jgi:AGZA family xanthine/uracil permease-like MFS transporter